MKITKRTLSAALAAVLLLSVFTGCKNEKPVPPAANSTGSASSSSNQDISFPTAPMTFLCNYSAGGSTDMTARGLADALSTELGVAVTVNNVEGGSGTVGVAELAKQKTDGYTIGLATLSPLAMAPWQMEVTYTPDDFDYLCAIVQYGYGIVASADSPYQTLDDLLEASKSESIQFAATGYPQPFLMNDLGTQCGGSFEWVSYASSTDMITDILGNFIQVAVVDESTYIPYIENGQVRLLASATDKRWDCAPDVPTLAEAGYDAAILSYMGVCMPDDADAAVVAKLRQACEAAANSDSFKETCETLGMNWCYMSGEDYETVVRDKYAEFEAVFSN